MNVSVEKSLYFGEVNASPSKSYAHRLIISACLKKGETVIKNVGDSEDVLATARCMNALGAQVSLEDGNAKIIGIEKVNKNALLDAGESGSTLRFLIPVVTALGADATFTGRGKLLSRPNDALIKTLGENGAKVNGVNAFGKLKSGVYEIDATISSQYLTGLLFALPLLDGDSKIVFKGVPVSKNYLDITKEILVCSGIKFIEEENGYLVFGNQQYNLPNEVVCEGDWSSAAFMLVAGAIGKSVTVKGLNLNSTQGDKVVLDVLSSFGAEVVCKENEVTVSKKDNKPFTVNLENAPDLAPILSILASCGKGESRLYGVERLKIKESDRITAILDMLNSAGVQAEYNGEYLSVYGSEEIKSSTFDGYNDHRIVMSAVLLSGLARGNSVVTTCEAVKKSYPNFYNDLQKIGGKFNV